jgi:hypothetical protein
MTFSKKILKVCASTVLFSILAKMVSIFKVNTILGSFMASFSGVNAITPLVGVFGGVAGSCSFLGLGLLVRFLLTSSLSFHYLAYHIPGFFASLYRGSNSIFIRLVTPLACMVLFLLHPVGLQAAPYALYWFIPVALFFIPKTNKFLEAFGCTFVAHAIGSMIVYTSRAPACVAES